MTTSRFFASLAAALAVLVIFNVFLALRIDSVPKKIMREMRALPQIDILFVGNSLVQDGFDTREFTEAWPKADGHPIVFNAGLSGSDSVEHFLLARDAYLHHPHIRCLVYGFYDDLLTEPPDYEWRRLTGNKAVSYSPEYAALAASLYAPGSDYEKWRFQLIGAIPMLREHSQLWKFVEIFRRKLAALGTGPAPDYMFPMPPIAPFFEQLNEEERAAVPLIAPMHELFRMAQKDGTRVFLVEMPMITKKRQRIGSTPQWQEYRAYLKKLCEAEGVAYIDASEWVTDDTCYFDDLHLSGKGAVILSGKMAHYLSAQLSGN